VNVPSDATKKPIVVLLREDVDNCVAGTSKPLNSRGTGRARDRIGFRYGHRCPRTGSRILGNAAVISKPHIDAELISLIKKWLGNVRVAERTMSR
jgi:hypothetical protein